jgi:hypothetical protein
MNPSGSRFSLFSPFQKLSRIRLRPVAFFGIIILTALLAFELFNYSTTQYALQDLLGDLRFGGLLWSTILSIAFCGIDFAGIARLFTPEQSSDEPREIWYLFGAWLLAATMNAILTWWGVSMAIINHSEKSAAVLGAATLTKVVPIFVAIMVWVIRILIIGSISYAGDRLLWGSTRSSLSTTTRRNPIMASPVTPPAMINHANLSPRNSFSGSRSPASEASPSPLPVRPEPTYHSISMGSRSPLRNSPTEDSPGESRKL